MFLTIRQYSQGNTCVFNIVTGLHNFLENQDKIKNKTCKWFLQNAIARRHANYVCFHKLILATSNMAEGAKQYVHFRRWEGLNAHTRIKNYMCIGGKKLRFILSDYGLREGNHARFELLCKII